MIVSKKGWMGFVSIMLLATAVQAQVGPLGSPPPNVAVPPTAAKFPDLSWTASITSGVTYDVYRGIVSGGPYGKVNIAPVTLTTYRDTTAAFGVQNFYVVLAKDNVGNTSVYSNQVSGTAVAATPGSPAPPSGLNAVVAVLKMVGKAIFAAIKWLGTFGGYLG